MPNLIPFNQLATFHELFEFFSPEHGYFAATLSVTPELCIMDAWHDSSQTIIVLGIVSSLLDVATLNEHRKRIDTHITNKCANSVAEAGMMPDWYTKGMLCAPPVSKVIQNAYTKQLQAKWWDWKLNEVLK